ncbi:MULTISPECIES: cytochrome c biogenesis protein DipZ [unclassified Sphingomonas]|uniref:cytochrome c biogenesis protein DipZ n=1 Tax=unclassified Sphingomonas TaxID=196159 RepID=UPI00092AFF13|nr:MULTISPECIES: cytochrome c biogenesis protein DipZ [unclassified Sphingomonas]MBN8849596.1 cytochrome c biogenesis protein DipZ [Sphingomonas sp.]OJV31048.1 MAG: cytochrome C biogenesis protein [Sphingomonas sp. 67-36]
MILFLLAYLGGALTILSPCILPVLPFVFARADRPFRTNGLPMLIGMAAMFMAVATLAAIGGGWAVQANQYGRAAALILLALFGLALLFPAIADRAMRPLVGFGARLSQTADAQGAGFGTSLLLGIATGLLWAPCAGPILGLILTGAALQGASVATSLLLLAYALGAATSLALALLAGGRLFKAMKRSLGAGEWIRRAIGAAVLVAVAAIGLGADTGFLTRASLAGTNRIEQGLLDRFHMAGPPQQADSGKLADQGPMPSLDGAVAWLNSPPLGREALKGKVVVIDFWTYSCINCLRSLPYVKAWAEKYRGDGLVVIGVHTPEFAFEKDIANVRKALADLGITYPVAIDNDYAVWRAFANHYWPAHYFIDANGRLRYRHFGEGDYAGSERVIRALLAEAHPGRDLGAMSVVRANGVQAASARGRKSPETYIGYARAARSVSRPDVVKDRPATYDARPVALDQWGLSGRWTVGPEHASLDKVGGRILYRFHARDLHLVLGPGADRRPIRFRVTIDGRQPGPDHGSDTDAAGNGIVTGQRLYQLVRIANPGADHDFAIDFIDPGVQAFSFTFG